MALDRVRGKLHALGVLHLQKELLVLNRHKAGHSGKEKNHFSLLGLTAQFFWGTVRCSITHGIATWDNNTVQNTPHISLYICCDEVKLLQTILNTE
jgi:hypothetical protein